MKLMFIDVKKAHLNGTCDDEVCVERPEEERRPGLCARVKRWLYGMRGAAQSWARVVVIEGGEWCCFVSILQFCWSCISPWSTRAYVLVESLFAVVWDVCLTGLRV